MTKQKKPRRQRGGPRLRSEPDVRLTVRFHTGRDDDLLAWLQDLPERQKAESVRQALRQHLRNASKQDQG
jgi:hypothetical protein